ncbi:Crocetin glucosyltransferase 3 [Linum perenne]
MDTFFRSSTTLKSSVHDLLVKITAEEGRPPLCLIFDVFFGWASEVAADNKTLNVTFTTAGAYGTLAYASIWMNLSHKEEPDSETFDVPGFGDLRCPRIRRRPQIPHHAAASVLEKSRQDRQLVPNIPAPNCQIPRITQMVMQFS